MATQHNLRTPIPGRHVTNGSQTALDILRREWDSLPWVCYEQSSTMSNERVCVVELDSMHHKTINGETLPILMASDRNWMDAIAEAKERAPGVILAAIEGA